MRAMGQEFSAIRRFARRISLAQQADNWMLIVFNELP
jgi:hypothetical protein